MTQPRTQIEDLLRIQVVSDAQLSPDGGKLLFLRKRIDEAKNRYLTSLWSTPTSGESQPAQLTQEEEGLSQGRFSPDGATVAFVSKREGKRPQLYLLTDGQGEARRLTGFPEGVIGPMRWSPDGRTIAVLFRPELAERRESAVKERSERSLSPPPVVTETGWYRVDGDGVFGHERFAIHLVDVASGRAVKLYDRAALGAYVFEWMPDSRALVVAHSVHPNPWVKPLDERLYLVEARPGGEVRELAGVPKGRKITLAISPDGAELVYLGHESGDDFWGVHNAQLFLVPLREGRGAGRCLTADIDHCLSFTGMGDMRDAPLGLGLLHWSPDAKRVFLNWSEQGGTCLGSFEFASGKLTRHWQGESTLVVTSLSRDAKLAGAVFDDPTHPTEAAVVPMVEGAYAPKRLTQFNADYVKSTAPLTPEEIWVESADGHRVHAWVLRPSGATKDRPCPAVLSIHGGPYLQYSWGFFHEFQALATEGYAVVYPNPRGSKGYGQAHCEAISGNWGDRDWEDVQAVTRWMKAQPWIDGKRLAITGGSYGGYMTCWAIAHAPGEYRAAITDRCVSNLVSMCGTSDYFINRDSPWKGSVLGGLDSIATLWKQSPLAHFENVVTPTLVIHSEGDLRCNIEQAEQVFAALQIRGVESRFVRYPRECSHGLSRGGPPDLRLHRLREMTAWLRRQLGA